MKDHVVQTEQKKYGPVPLGNAAETLTKTVISAQANKDRLSKRTAALMVTRKPSKTVGYSDISAFGTS